MKLRIMKAIGAVVLLATSAFAAGPIASNGALDIKATSNGVIFNDTNPQHIDALVSVVDNDGAPVAGLTAGQFVANTFFTPTGAVCGLGLLGVQEKEPGFYNITLSRGNEQQCKWGYGDYLMRVALYLGNAQGQTTLKVTVKQIPVQGWQ